MSINNKKIFIFGGSGSLGNKLIEKYLSNNIIINFSRDECKHWMMESKYSSPNLKNIIGNINDPKRIKISLLRENPHIIIIAAALKHIDRCEYASSESLNTNLLGIKNILDCVEESVNQLINLETVLFVSTDKACSPINIYGMCKALSEKLVVEKSYFVKNIKFVTIRYGNVLNSRGSIIHILHNMGKDENISHFSLTNTKMTRFIMTLEESCDLIEYAIQNGESGDIVIPKLSSMLVKDLFEIFSEKYGKSIKITGLRPGEKIDEALINETQSMRVTETENYYHIKANYLAQTNTEMNLILFNYDSSQNNIGKNELKDYLEKFSLL